MEVTTKEKNRQQKREDILLEAERIFSDKGYVATTTEEIAEITGHSVGTIYNYFRSKDLLFAEVVLRIAQDLIREVEQDLLSHSRTPETTLERQVQIRIANYARYRLFFQLFINNGPMPSPKFEDLPNPVYEAYLKYLRMMEALFLKILGHREGREGSGIGWVLGFDGYVNLYMGYLEHGRNDFSPAKACQFVRRFFCGGSAAEPMNQTLSENAAPEPKQIFITRFDRMRLMDLITVFRSLKHRQVEKHLLMLEQELKKAKVVPSADVPSDVVTMNSRIKLMNKSNQSVEILTLAFPVDAGLEGSLSVLDPVGTAILGHRVGDEFEVMTAKRKLHYRIEDLLYQPEAAGDFHL